VPSKLLSRHGAGGTATRTQTSAYLDGPCQRRPEAVGGAVVVPELVGLKGRKWPATRLGTYAGKQTGRRCSPPPPRCGHSRQPEMAADRWPGGSQQ
jgi:hypothetical protein